MFKYKKALKEVDKFEEMIKSIKNNTNNSGYRIEISYANGKLYQINDIDNTVKVYVTHNYNNYNDKNYIMNVVGANSNKYEELLPCTIHGDPIANKGKIKDIQFNKEELLKKLKEEKNHIVNSQYGTVKKVESTDNYEMIKLKNIYQDYIHAYF